MCGCMELYFGKCLFMVFNYGLVLMDRRLVVLVIYLEFKLIYKFMKYNCLFIEDNWFGF